MPPRILLVDEAQRAVAGVLRFGGIAIDATAGNGHDTVFLAKAVGPTGKVYAFDIQQTALTATAARLQQAGLAAQVELILAGHETMAQHLAKDHIGKIAAIMFNLGYLPGGDKSVITAAATTLQALDEAARLLAPNGILTILAYPGHCGGDTEATAVRHWCEMLHKETFFIQHLCIPDNSKAPQLWVVRNHQ